MERSKAAAALLLQNFGSRRRSSSAATRSNVDLAEAFSHLEKKGDCLLLEEEEDLASWCSDQFSDISSRISSTASDDGREDSDSEDDDSLEGVVVVLGLNTACSKGPPGPRLVYLRRSHVRGHHPDPGSAVG